jgi:hypothetical protein
MKTRRRIGLSLVLELASYTTLTALHLWGGEATAKAEEPSKLA